MRTIIVLCLSVLFLTGCSSDPKNTSSKSADNRYLPNTILGGDNIWVISDTSDWNNGLQDLTNKIFESSYEMLPQDERCFHVSGITYFDFNDLMRRNQCILFEVNLQRESRLTRFIRKNFAQKIKTVEGSTHFFVKDLWAKGQLVGFILANNKEQLFDHVSQNEDQLRNIYLDFVIHQQAKRFMNSPKNAGVSQKFLEKFNLNLHVPKEYRTGADLENFYWAVKETRTGYMGVVAYAELYSDSAQLRKQHILDLRDSILGQVITGEDANNHMISDRRILILERQGNFKGKYAKTLSGLWQLKGIYVGGPFKHYVIYDNISKSLLHIDLFVTSPGDDKKPLMQELEAIIQTAKN